MKIEFLAVDKNVLIEPIPSKDYLPDWYKKAKPYFSEEKSTLWLNGLKFSNATVKKCMPVFDILTAGYLIKTWADIHVVKIDGITTYKIEEPILDQHIPEQSQSHPSTNPNSIMPKIINQWGVKTPKGYSCLFKPPSHRDNIISILEGVVDTDTYNLPVHFPFALTDSNFEGTIPKGTPISQVIPFKRSEWKMSCKVINPKHLKIQKERLGAKLFNSYRDTFRNGTIYS